MRVAVADVGTSSSHLLVAQTEGENGYRVLDALKDATRLGECLAPDGTLTAEGEDRLASALTRFRELALGAGAAEVRVYATSALREAPNGAAVAERMRERTGIYPTIISGEREGELTYLGAASSVDMGDDNVLLDLGGGSLEFVRGNATHPEAVQSLPLGSIRMTGAFVPDGVGKDAQIKALRQEVRRQLAPHQPTFQARPGTRFILSSGTAQAAAIAIAASRGQVGSVNGTQFTLTELANLLGRVTGTKPAARHKFPGLERRLDTIVAGLTVLHAALDMLSAGVVTVSEGALREGMLLEELSRFSSFKSGLSARQRSVLATAERFGVNPVHGQQVAQLSRDLLGALQEAGEDFPEDARSLLTAAAALHETGLIVAQSSHHKHSAYLIRHAGLRGFSPREIELIAQIARYHRKSPPRPAHPEFMALLPADQRLVSRLAAILRVADGLDRSHSGNASVESLIRSKNGWALHVQGASPLDVTGLQKKADLWEKEFGALALKVMT
ncbi:Ppx/GppA family phosphatase [Deinococcus cavernae]|uniref:Ppx/GppA family phosphatase n=1 Tax=Deinococcus cavernae TaxID=2320857 RepID=A0A418V519_9DEIO|nr:Ppx/GppA phosphatase family protein [Deinococcus cavernae]RJF71201.1 Ppx/GppA family phosphatase [Deinococcus cavernae]